MVVDAKRSSGIVRGSKLKLSKEVLRVHRYWRNPPKKNSPEAYLTPPDNRSEYLVKLVQKHVNISASILEIGCNVGRNLNELFQSGYKKLTGVEISAGAVTLMQKAFPEMSKHAKILTVPIEDVIKNFRDNSFDLVFTMAVLMHIHPDSEFVFEEIARITRRFLMLVEGENTFQRGRYFGRFYRPIFEQLGMVQIFQENLTQQKTANSKTMWTRIFKKREKGSSH